MSEGEGRAESSILPAASAAAVSALEQRAWRAFQKGRLERAGALATRITHLAPERAWAHYLLGELASKSGQWEEASRGFERAIALGREDAETLVRAGEAAIKSGRREQGAAHLERALRTGTLSEARSHTIRRAIAQMRQATRA